MPAIDIGMIGQLGRELHSVTPGVMGEGEVCPWTLFMAMALTLLKGVLPYVPSVLPAIVSDPEVRRRAEETFTDPEFINNIDDYFVKNIKEDVQAPLNRQILKSSEAVMMGVNVVDSLFKNFAPAFTGDFNDLGETDNMPRSFGELSIPELIHKGMNFYNEMMELTKK